MILEAMGWRHDATGGLGVADIDKDEDEISKELCEGGLCRLVSRTLERLRRLIEMQEDRVLLPSLIGFALVVLDIVMYFGGSQRPPKISEK
jgi:hypothetical protein